MDEQNTTDTPKKSNTTKMAVIAVVVVLLVIVSVIGFQAMNGKKAITDTATQESTTTTNETAVNASPYKNGTYTQTGEYVSPGGPETLEVTVTLTNGKITDSTVVPQAFRPTSKEKQADFTAHYKPMVIGKSIDEVMLTKVSGSSLSPKGFNDALEKIKVEAKS